MSERRVIHHSKRVEISTNIPDVKWPTREEKISGLLSSGLIDEAEADRLRSKSSELEDRPDAD